MSDNHSNKTWEDKRAWLIKEFGAVDVVWYWTNHYAASVKAWVEEEGKVTVQAVQAGESGETAIENLFDMLVGGLSVSQRLVTQEYKRDEVFRINPHSLKRDVLTTRYVGPI